jgi:hypothetical protein
LSPKPIHDSPSGWEGLEGAAIEISRITSENSGRYEVAGIMARVFPEHRTFAGRILKIDDFPFPSGAYPNDTLKYIDETVVEYTTPAQTEGLGNFDSWLGKSDTPITGVAILFVDPANTIGYAPAVVLLSVRISPDLARLAPVIIGYVERTLAPHN